MISKFSGPHEFLSNGHFCPITWQGIEYPTVEHAFQASKSLDTKIRLKISRARTPRGARSMGHQVDLRPDWEEVKREILSLLILKKFGESPYKELLLDTGDEELFEGNTWSDRFWGVSKRAMENRLGKILMEVRRKLRESLVG